MYVTFALWMTVAIISLVFAASGFWQAINKRAVKPALASGSPLRFGIAMFVFASICASRGIGLAFP